jgi:hypothetical protein
MGTGRKKVPRFTVQGLENRKQWFRRQGSGFRKKRGSAAGKAGDRRQEKKRFQGSSFSGSTVGKAGVQATGVRGSGRKEVQRFRKDNLIPLALPATAA